jgi:hypothetical protein
MMNMRSLMVMVATIVCAAGAADADVLYDGFDYGQTDGALVGLGTAADGWGGAWEDGNSATAWAANYQTGGLGIGSGLTTLVANGGNAQVTGETSGNQYGRYGRKIGRIDSQNIDWTNVYGSYLVRIDSRESTPDDDEDYYVLQTAIQTSVNDNGGSAEFSADNKAWDAPEVRATIGSNKSLAGAGMGVGTTYLMLFAAEGLGDTSTPALSIWLLTSDQFDNFKAEGLTKAELDGASEGALATDVTAKASVSGGDADFLTDQYLQFFHYGRSGLAIEMQYDEIRLSDESLDAVTPVIPEPATMAVLGLGGLAMLRRRRA